MFTSIIPSLLGSGVPEALERFEGPVVYAANVMTQPGETSGFAVSDHLRALMDHAGRVVTDVLVNAETLPTESVDRYGSEGSVPVEVDVREIEQMRVRVHEADLLSADAAAGIRHDPDKLGRALVGIPSVPEPRSGG